MHRQNVHLFAPLLLRILENEIKFQSNNVANNVKIDDWLLPESIICEAKVSAIRVDSWLTVAI